MSTAKRTTCALSLLALCAAGGFLVAIWPRVLARWNVARLDHRDHAVREAAAEALGRLGLLETVPPLLEAVAAERISPEAAARSFVLFGRPILPALLEAVSDPRRALRQSALEGILGIETDEHAPEAKLLRDLSTSDRDQQAIWTLSRLDPPSTVAVLTLAGMARDSTYRYPHFAADALGEIGPAAVAAVPALLAVIADGRASQRGNIALGLTEIAPGDERVVEALVRAHADDVLAGLGDFAHELLVDAIGKLGPAARASVPSLVRDLERGQGAIRWKAGRALGAIGPDALEGPEAMAALVAALRSGDEDLVSSAGDALLSFGAAAVPSLAEAAELPLSHRSRWTAVQILGIIGSRAREAVPVLLELLDVPDLRLDAVVALGGIGPPAERAIPALLRLYRGEDDAAFSWRLSETLSRIGPASLGGLTRMFAEGDAKLRLRILRTVAEMEALPDHEQLEVAAGARAGVGPRLTRPQLEAAFEDPAGLFDPAAISDGEAMDLLPLALEKLRRNDGDLWKVFSVLERLGPRAAAAVTELIDSFEGKSDEGDLFARRELMRAIARVSDPTGEAGPFMRSALDSGDLVVALRASHALWRRGELCDRRLSSIVTRLFREHVAYIHFGGGPWYTPEDRHEAARVLAEMGPRGRDALPALERAIGDPEPRFRALAALALWKVSGEGRLEDVMRALLSAAADRRDPTSLLAGAAGSARSAVSQALGEIGKVALPSILSRLDDPDEQVRMALVEGLGSMGPAAAPSRSALVARLDDEDFRVYRLAKEALRRLDE